MSKRINVNPDHYKTAGRERQGEDIVHKTERQRLRQTVAAEKRWRKQQKRKQQRS